MAGNSRGNLITTAADQESLRQWMEGNGVTHVGGHYVFTDGDHCDIYVDMANMLSRTSKAWEVARTMASGLEPHQFDTIAAPPHADYGWGLLLSLAIYQDFDREVNFAYAQEVTETITAVANGVEQKLKVVTPTLDFPRQQAKFIKGLRVLIVCDVFSKGSTAKKMIDAVRRAGGLVAGIAVVCSHSEVHTFAGVKVYTFMRMDADFHQPPCPEGWPPINTDLGHGKEYLASLRGGTVN